MGDFMKRKLVIGFSLVSLLVGIIGFVRLNMFICFDCKDLMQAGYTREIGLGMALVISALLAYSIPALILDFIKLCKSSGSPDDK